MSRKFTKEEMKLRRAGQLRAVLQLERAAAQWASEDPEYAAQRAKEARELRKDISLLEINNQLDLYKRLAATHGVEEEAEFQRRRHKGEFAGHRSGKVRAVKAKDSRAAILRKAKLGRTRYRSLSQKDLAAEAGCTIKLIRGFERGGLLAKMKREK